MEGPQGPEAPNPNFVRSKAFCTRSWKVMNKSLSGLHAPQARVGPPQGAGVLVYNTMGLLGLEYMGSKSAVGPFLVVV